MASTPAGQTKIGFLHTTPKTIPMVDDLLARYMPDARTFNFLDDAVKIANFDAPIGETPKENLLRWAKYARYLEQQGCSAVLSCCSLMPQATEYAKQVLNVPMVQMDAPAVDKAIEHKRIGVIGTVERASFYLKGEIERKTALLGKTVELDYRINADAWGYFSRNEIEAHDEIVLADIKKMDDSDVDCILLAQIPLGLLEDRALAMGLKKPLYCAGKLSFDWVKQNI
ncbi:MAG: hypothetical protein FWE12_08895 [Oscillospiraceae bacterium]|nr:hypothetical protein [Oscillospiraceae bacterium]